MGSPARRPRVAIVVLSWNGRDDTLGCLASLRAVEHEPLDVIVVDNGSTDATARVAMGFETDSFDVRVVFDPRPGVNVARNAGIRVARGPLVLLCDGDDAVDPDWLTEMAQGVVRQGLSVRPKEAGDAALPFAGLGGLR